MAMPLYSVSCANGWAKSTARRAASTWVKRSPGSIPCWARLRRTAATVSARSAPRWYTRGSTSATCLSAKLIASTPFQYSRATSSAVSGSA